MVYSRLREKLRQTLLERIVAGRLVAGERVNEARLATQLKVSRTPLREALLQLERDGFTRSDLRRGFSVEQLSAPEIREVYPMIWTLEGLAVRSGAVFAHLVVPKLRQINAQLAKTLDPRRGVELDTEGHETLTGQSRNSRLAGTLDGLRLAVRRYELFYMADAQLIAESVAQHAGIIDSLKRRDIETAVKGLAWNWRFGMQLLLRRMGEEP